MKTNEEMAVGSTMNWNVYNYDEKGKFKPVMENIPMQRGLSTSNPEAFQQLKNLSQGF